MLMKKLKCLVIIFICTSIYLIVPYISKNEIQNMELGDPIWPHVTYNQKNLI